MKNLDISISFADNPTFDPKIISYNLNSSFTNPFSTLSLSFYYPYIKEAIGYTNGPRRIQFSINNRLQFDGRIESQEIDDDGIITLDCANYLNPLNQQSFEGTINIKQAETIKTALERNLAHLGFGTVYDDWSEIKQARNGVKYNTNPSGVASKKIGAEWKKSENEEAFALINRMIERYNVYLQVYKYPDIAIVKPTTTGEYSYSLVRNAKDKTSNVIGGSVKRDWSNAITYAQIEGRNKGKGVKTSALGPIPAESFFPTDFEYTNVKKILQTSKLSVGDASDPSKLYIPYYMQDKKSQTEEELNNKTKRTIKKFLKETCSATYTIAGHDIDDVFIIPDTLINVADEIGNLYENMWVDNVAYSYRENAGQSTQITCYRPGTISMD
jgi:hypothetical protein